ncbi:hypothetical protein PGT21_005987 [Puccinia graminis f. sp. tritici]|uniref:Uncharacterized protein n=1 Tax=Puccinia graminis f. sp. tritici TaxID=56615 RepID=A0A5B0LXU8_PUCGR|nr:hypothetical protein PGT21_005987 [Puccinia graminis f. sp. tritici]
MAKICQPHAVQETYGISPRGQPFGPDQRRGLVKLDPLRALLPIVSPVLPTQRKNLSETPTIRQPKTSLRSRLQTDSDRHQKRFRTSTNLPNLCLPLINFNLSPPTGPR